jgi:hypothetical protein
MKTISVDGKRTEPALLKIAPSKSSKSPSAAKDVACLMTGDVRSFRIDLGLLRLLSGISSGSMIGCVLGERSKTWHAALLSGSTKSVSEVSESEEASTVGTGVRSPNSLSSKLASAGLP